MNQRQQYKLLQRCKENKWDSSLSPVKTDTLEEFRSRIEDPPDMAAPVKCRKWLEHHHEIWPTPDCKCLAPVQLSWIAVDLGSMR